MSFMDVDRSDDRIPKTMEQLVPESHLARFVLKLVSLFDLSSIEETYDNRGKQAYMPSMLLALILYALVTGTTSCREIERLTHESFAYAYICGFTHPHHTTISRFRERFLDEINEIFVMVLIFAFERGLLTSDTACIDGTKMEANASIHHAYSYARALEIKAQYEQEIIELQTMATDPGSVTLPGIDVADEINRRKNKISVLNAALDGIIQNAAERFERQMADYQAKLDNREQLEQQTGKKPRGKMPSPPVEGPLAKDQYNITDPDSRVMPKGKGFSQAYNAQAAVEAGNMLILAATVSQNPNDMNEMVPVLDELSRLPTELQIIVKILADAGYCSEKNIIASLARGLDPYFAAGRFPHHQSLPERFAQEPPALPEIATVMDQMRHKLRTLVGRNVYKLRKQVVEPVFGVIKSVMRVRRFTQRGLEKVRREWKLICTAYNIKKIFNKLGTL